MKYWQENRQRSLAELSLGAHILAYLITIIILIVVGNLKEYIFYTSTVVLMGTVLPAALFILLDYHYLQRWYSPRVMFWWNLFSPGLVLVRYFGSGKRERRTVSAGAGPDCPHDGYQPGRDYGVRSSSEYCLCQQPAGTDIWFKSPCNAGII